jgi:LmbE family N-acetylglucosaminyl deacetylase
VATLVCFHAHPDDESIMTAGTMARAADAGHRVVLVVATRGELAAPKAGVLADGEELWQRRVQETHASAEVLGVGRVEFLGYEDSGMMGEPTNEHTPCFWQADLDVAAQGLAAILRQESADVLTVYDANGGYGHPDHIQVHRVGCRAAELAGVERVFQATMNRDHILRLMDESALAGSMTEEEQGELDRDSFGSLEEDITHAVDVVPWLDRKRASMVAHASQISAEDFFLTLPPEAFAAGFGTEWYIALGGARPPGEPFATDLLDG